MAESETVTFTEEELEAYTEQIKQETIETFANGQAEVKAAHFVEKGDPKIDGPYLDDIRAQEEETRRAARAKAQKEGLGHYEELISNDTADFRRNERLVNDTFGSPNSPSNFGRGKAPVVVNELDLNVKSEPISDQLNEVGQKDKPENLEKSAPVAAVSFDEESNDDEETDKGNE